jgi:hypothetical protein
MIADVLFQLRSRAATPAPFRRHLADAFAYWQRGTRLALTWAPHLANCRTLIDPTIDDIASRRTVVVLGSGPLFEIPLEALARNFGRVLIVDRVHLAGIDQRIRRYPNVERIWRDIGGTDRPLDFLDDVIGLDWVISANVLSDLGREQGRVAIEAHLEGLRALPCPVTLVTDIDYRCFDRAGTLVENVDLMQGVKLPVPELNWIWEAAPFGEDGPDRRRVHSVAAWADWHSAKMSQFGR